MSDEERHARTREGMQAHLSRPEIAARFQEACARSENTDPLTELRAGLRELRSGTDRLWSIAKSEGWDQVRIHLSYLTANLRDASDEADRIALQRGIADTHEGRVCPWSSRALGTDTAAEAANASEQAHSPVSVHASQEPDPERATLLARMEDADSNGTDEQFRSAWDRLIEYDTAKAHRGPR